MDGRLGKRLDASPLTSPAEATERPLKSTVRRAAELEAVGAVERREVDIGGEARGLAEHHIARAGKAAVRVGAVGADDHVGEAVAVDVAGRGDRAAAGRRRRAAELEAVRRRARQIDIGGERAVWFSYANAGIRPRMLPLPRSPTAAMARRHERALRPRQHASKARRLMAERQVRRDWDIDDPPWHTFFLRRPPVLETVTRVARNLGLFLTRVTTVSSCGCDVRRRHAGIGYKLPYIIQSRPFSRVTENNVDAAGG